LKGLIVFKVPRKVEEVLAKFNPAGGIKKFFTVFPHCAFHNAPVALNIHVGPSNCQYCKAFFEFKVPVEEEECRDELPLGQIPATTEDDHCKGIDARLFRCYIACLQKPALYDLTADCPYHVLMNSRSKSLTFP